MLERLIHLDRISKNRNKDPSLAMIDTQSVKTASNFEQRGYDGGKKN